MSTLQKRGSQQKAYFCFFFQDIGQGISDILIINETKLDTSIPNLHKWILTSIEIGLNLDSGSNYDDITSKMLTKHKFRDDIEELFVEINFRKCNWLLYGFYHPPSQSDQHFFDNLDKTLEVYSSYEEVLITGDIAAQEREMS